MNFHRQSWGLAGSLFVSVCCLGAGPIIAAAVTALGLSLLKPVFSIYVLGPLMIASVAWVVWNLTIQARALGHAFQEYLPFWLTLGGGALAVVGVFLPHLVHGTGAFGYVLIVIGMAALLTGSVLGLLDQRKEESKQAP
jgi:hypothetical protein